MSNLLIFGPPGTGKTHRLLDLIRDYCVRSAGRILFCSHTRAAAQEATSRWPEELAERIDIQTLHSVCFRALKVSKAQTVDVAKLTDFGEQYGIDMSDQGLGPDFIDVLSLARSRLIEPMAGYAQSWRPGTGSHFESFVKSYNSWKEQYGYMDFDDMLFVGALRLTRRVVDYDLVVIDEAQDLTPLHWSVVYKLVDILPGSRFIVAGDDDQTLYSFAGADPQGMADFGNQTLADFEVLSQSYRIPQAVYNLAQAIIARVQMRFPKEYRPRVDEDGRPVQGRVEMWPNLDHMSRKLSRVRDSLVLFNDKFVRAEVEPMLQESGINYRALNGFPSPLDSRAGRTLQAVFRNTDGDILNDPDADQLRTTVRSGLSARAQGAWDANVRPEILARLRRQDFSVLALKPQFYDYMRAADLSRAQNVRISTMHGAKGLQGNDVHLVLSLSDGATREAMVAPDHLHRLLYTAVTRTRENLYLYDGLNGYELPEGWQR